MVLDEQDGDSGYFAQPPLEVLVACRHDEAPMHLDAVHDAVIGIGSFVVARQMLEPWVLGEPQG